MCTVTNTCYVLEIVLIQLSRYLRYFCFMIATTGTMLFARNDQYHD